MDGRLVEDSITNPTKADYSSASIFIHQKHTTFTKRDLHSTRSTNGENVSVYGLGGGW